jgi:hypothetical protein
MAHCKIPIKSDGPKAPTAIYDPLGFTFHPLEKANAISDCIENQFAQNIPRTYNRERPGDASPGSTRSCRQQPP